MYNICMGKTGLDETKQHPMRLAVRRSGLTPHVIRVWERRYAAVQPARTETNRRTYSDLDIERLRLLHLATEQGHPISRIARLSAEALNQLLRRDIPYGAATAAFGSRQAGGDSRSPASGDAGPLCERCLDAVQRFDGQLLQAEMARASTVLPRRLLLEDVLTPFMCHIGEMWAQGRLRVSHEHLASAVVRAFLDTLQTVDMPPDGAPAIVLTTPVGQLHEIGAMMAGALASADGWRSTYLGPNLPAAEIASAAAQQQARTVGLSITCAQDDMRLAAELATLRRAIGPDVPILVGGCAAMRYAELLERTGAIHVQRLADLSTHLVAIRNAV